MSSNSLINLIPVSTKNSIYQTHYYLDGAGKCFRCFTYINVKPLSNPVM